MADSTHNSCNLAGSHKAPYFALGRYVIWQLMIIRLFHCRVMETDAGRMNAHIQKNDYRLRVQSVKPQVIRQVEGDVGQNTVNFTMSYPKLTIEVTRPIIRCRTVYVG